MSEEENNHDSNQQQPPLPLLLSYWSPESLTGFSLDNTDPITVSLELVWPSGQDIIVNINTWMDHLPPL